MPNHDGTGPFGIGARTGRSQGPCSGPARWSMRPGRTAGALAALAVTVTTALVRELMRPASTLRLAIRDLLMRTRHRRMTDSRVDAWHEVVDETEKQS